MNDNRNYKYSIDSVSKREEYRKIIKWIKRGSKVIDLASGDGTFLKMLKEEGIHALGVEITPSGVRAAKMKGVRSVVGRVDTKLPYKDKEFDYAICNVTLHMVMYPEVLLQEMVRISKKQIITFPNFAHFANRLDLLFFGRMPHFTLFGYKWFSTGAIHQLSIKDFLDYCSKNKIKIVKAEYEAPEKILSIPIRPLVKLFPNLFASIGIYMTKK